MKLYYQCRLRRGVSQTTRWIEQRGAKVGATVEVLPDRELWKVVEVYRSTPMPEDALKEHQRMHRGSLASIERMA
jgi:hypothetical protein